MERELLVVERGVEVVTQQHLLRGDSLAVAPVPLPGVAPLALGAAHGEIGLLQQLLGMAGLAVAGADADAGADVHGMPLQVVGAAERGQQATGQVVAGLAPATGQQQAELVAGQARNGVAGGDQAAQPLGDGHQQGIAHAVTQAVVDRLEAVQVQLHHQQWL